MKLKINFWAGIIDIINCILCAISWFSLFVSAIVDAMNNVVLTSLVLIILFYLFAWSGIIINIIALIKSSKVDISITGPVLGIIGNSLLGITTWFAFPALIVLIVATVFTMKN